MEENKVLQRQAVHHWRMINSKNIDTMVCGKSLHIWNQHKKVFSSRAITRKINDTKRNRLSNK